MPNLNDMSEICEYCGRWCEPIIDGDLLFCNQMCSQKYWLQHITSDDNIVDTRDRDIETEGDPDAILADSDKLGWL